MGKEGAGSGGGDSGMSESVIRKVLVSYMYVAVWIFLSFAVIVYNKYILDPKMYNWPFPISLTMIHMASAPPSPRRSSACSASSTSPPRRP